MAQLATPPDQPQSWDVLARQGLASLGFACLLGAVISLLYWQSRQQEWLLREEQAMYRLNLAQGVVTSRLLGVESDLQFLASHDLVEDFIDGNAETKNSLDEELLSFARHKGIYDQVRLLDHSGHELVRVQSTDHSFELIADDQLQDKCNRYYFKAARLLKPGEIYISEFDLNIEFGQIEKPLKPVIRFVAPALDSSQQIAGYMVLNYKGADLLDELEDLSVVGQTLLLRSDGNFIRGVDASDNWGWLLHHNRTFQQRFSNEWALRGQETACVLTANGAFAFRSVALGYRHHAENKPAQQPPDDVTIYLVSYVPAGGVFEQSNELLLRLVILSSLVFLPFLFFARFWARATLMRKIHRREIAKSAKHLRELSARLLRVQEDERRTIAREIHDELGQQVTAIKLDLQLTRSKIELGDAKQDFDRALSSLSELLQTLHSFATRVRPTILDDMGLYDAVESYVETFELRSKIDVNKVLDFADDEIPSEIADHVYRLIQESLNNVAKHAGASEVWIDLVVNTATLPVVLSLTVRDNGRGIAEPPPAKNGQLGLIGMQERVDLLGGTFQINYGSTDGTTISIHIPLPTDPTGEMDSI